MTGLRSPDTLLLQTPLGLLMRSAADRAKVDHGLEIDAERDVAGASAFRLQPTPSGHWVAHHLPGMRADVVTDPTRWIADGKPYHFSITDRSRRYLPIRFRAPLPRRSSLVWPGWAGVDRERIAPLLPPGSAASFVPDYMPVFPSVAASGSRATARVLAHIAIRETGGATRPACWALMTVSFGTDVIGLGLSDARGAIVVNFGYPPMPTPTPAEAAAGRDNVSWPVRIRIYCTELGDPEKPDDPPPDFADIIAQLATPPRVAMRTILGSQPALGDQTLVMGETLILRTRRSSTQFASSLFLKPA
jgi:hypothetical protein